MAKRIEIIRTEKIARDDFQTNVYLDITKVVGILVRYETEVNRRFYFIYRLSNISFYSTLHYDIRSDGGYCSFDYFFCERISQHSDAHPHSDIPAQEKVRLVP